MNTRILIGSLTLILISSSAFANVGKLGQILQQQREIREQSEKATGAYARFERSALDRMHASQDRIFRLLDGVSSIEQLDSTQQAELFNALEEVKAVLTQNQDDKQICWREHKLGTTMKTTRCETVAERRLVREGAQDWYGTPSICGGRESGVDCGGNSRSERAFGR